MSVTRVSSNERYLQSREELENFLLENSDIDSGSQSSSAGETTTSAKSAKDVQRQIRSLLRSLLGQQDGSRYSPSKAALEQRLIQVMRQHPYIASEMSFGSSNRNRTLLSVVCKLDCNLPVIQAAYEINPDAAELEPYLLHEACQGASLDTVKFLVQKFPYTREIKDGAGKVPLSYAIVRNHESFARVATSVTARETFLETFSGLVSENVLLLLEKVRFFTHEVYTRHAVELVVSNCLGQGAASDPANANNAVGLEMGQVSIDDSAIRFVISCPQQVMEEKLPFVLRSLQAYGMSIRIENYEIPMDMITYLPLSGVTDLILDGCVMEGNVFETLMFECVSLRRLDLIHQHELATIRSIRARELTIEHSPQLLQSDFLGKFLLRNKRVKFINIITDNNNVQNKNKNNGNHRSMFFGAYSNNIGGYQAAIDALCESPSIEHFEFLVEPDLSIKDVGKDLATTTSNTTSAEPTSSIVGCGQSNAEYAAGLDYMTGRFQKFLSTVSAPF